jgi:hypothetical protein
MTTTYVISIVILLSLIVFLSSTASHVVSASEQQMMVARRRITASENIRMIGTGNSNGDDEDDVDNDDDSDDDNTDDHPVPTADEVFRCTERGSTGTPIYPFCPEGFPEGTDDNTADDDDAADDDYASHQTGDDVISYDKDCEAISSGSEISANEYVHKLTYQIDLALEIDGDIADTLNRLEEFLQMNIATDLTGCNPDSTVTSDVDLQYVLFDVSEDTESSEYHGW